MPISRVTQQLSSVMTADTALLTGHLLIGDARCPLIGSLLEGAKAAAMLFPPKDPPLEAMTAALHRRRAEGQQITTLHLIAHGRAGAFRFGDRWIDAEVLRANASVLASWGVETIALWSCHVGADADFVALLEELTGAKVLASADWLGRDVANEQLQLGDWQLSDLAKQEAWPVQFRLEEFDDELIEGLDQLTAADDETIDAGRGADEIETGLGDDRVDAGTGDDVVDAGKGDDSLDGGKGDDVLIGGFGDDTFKGGAGEDLFDLTLGNDVVTDFDPAEGDRIVLPDGQSFDLVDRGDDLLIRLEDGSTRLLEGVSRDEFDRYVDEALVSDDLIQPVETEISLTDGDDAFVPEQETDAPLKVDALSGNDQVSGGDDADCFFRVG